MPLSLCERFLLVLPGGIARISHQVTEFNFTVPVEVRV